MHVSDKAFMFVIGVDRTGEPVSRGYTFPRRLTSRQTYHRYVQIQINQVDLQSVNFSGDYGQILLHLLNLVSPLE